MEVVLNGLETASFLMKKIIGILFLLLQIQLVGNNLQLSNLHIVDKKIQFEISWENSWKIEESPANHDAVWIFFKVKQNSIWTHLDLNLQIDDFSILPESLEVALPNDKKGIMLRRKNIGIGDIEHVQIEIPIESVPANIEALKVFGIEMVYIPDGVFYFGDGISYNSIMHQSDSSAILIESESEMHFDTMNVICLEDSLLPQIVPLDFPKVFLDFIA